MKNRLKIGALLTSLTVLGLFSKGSAFAADPLANNPTTGPTISATGTNTRSTSAAANQPQTSTQFLQNKTLTKAQASAVPPTVARSQVIDIPLAPNGMIQTTEGPVQILRNDENGTHRLVIFNPGTGKALILTIPEFTSNDLIKAINPNGNNLVLATHTNKVYVVGVAGPMRKWTFFANFPTTPGQNPADLAVTEAHYNDSEFAEVTLSNGLKFQLDIRPTNNLVVSRIDAPFNERLVYTLYRSFMRRQTDFSGFNFWLNAVNNAQVSPENMVMAFAGSNEFFVAQIYRNILGRMPDTGGIAAWQNALAAGATREQVVNAIISSPEGQQTFGGMSRRDFIQFLYQHMLDRPADAGGLDAWDRSGLNLGQLFVAFFNSDEFLVRRVLYRGLLERDADPNGFNFWMGLLAKGASRSSVAKGFLDSVEFRAKRV